MLNDPDIRHSEFRTGKESRIKAEYLGELFLETFFVKYASLALVRK